MHRIFLYLVFAVVCVGRLQAQSLQITQFDSLVKGNAFTSDDIYCKASVRNNSSSPKIVKVKRYYNPSNALVDSNAICWGFCFEPEVNVSPVGITIAAGATNSVDFSGHVYPDKDGVARSGQIMYTFFVDESPSDSVSIIVTFEVTQTFSVSKLEGLNRIVSVYPNPASEFIDFNVELNLSERARVSFTDITGRIVKVVPLSSGDQKHRIVISDLNPGIYLYTLTVDGKPESTRRLVIKR
ncbi:MAG: T9SS type A sorting domain-containing protein [Thermaurantimonas sp.]